MSLFKKKNQNLDLCPHCMEVIPIHHPEYSYLFDCPNCHKPIYWDSNLRIVKKGYRKNNQQKDGWKLRKLTNKEWFYIGLCILITIINILVLNIANKCRNNRYERITNELILIETNIKNYIDQSKFDEASLEINKMSILDDLPDNKKAVWKADREFFIQKIKELNNNKASGLENDSEEKDSFWKKIFH